MSLLTEIRVKIAELISAMRVSNGYHHDWGSVNAFDTAIADQELVNYPTADISVVAQRNIRSTMHEVINEARMEITTKVSTKVEGAPERELIEDALEQCEAAAEDLEDLFWDPNTIRNLPIGVISITPDEEFSEFRPIFDNSRPGVLITRWKLTYRRTPGME